MNQGVELDALLFDVDLVGCTRIYKRVMSHMNESWHICMSHVTYE